MNTKSLLLSATSSADLELALLDKIIESGDDDNVRYFELMTSHLKSRSTLLRSAFYRALDNEGMLDHLGAPFEQAKSDNIDLLEFEALFGDEVISSDGILDGATVSKVRRELSLSGPIAFCASDAWIDAGIVSSNPATGDGPFP